MSGPVERNAGSPPEGVSPDAWAAIGAERQDSAWVIPERNAAGEVIGHSIRSDDGRKTCKPGSKRGLTMVWPLGAYAGTTAADPVFIVEGASDTGAGIGLRIDIVGRPSATGGIEHLLALLTGLHVCIIGENDGGAGRKGAEKIAAALVPVCASVRVIYPPTGIKDLRAWVVDGATRADIVAAADKAKPITPNADAAEPAAVGTPPIEPRFVSARELLANHPHLRPPVIHGLLRQGENLNLNAPSKRGKSWLQNYIALCVASGRTIFDRFRVERGSVLIVDNELHRETIAHRLPKVAGALGLTPAEWVDHVQVDCLRGRLVDLLAMELHYFPKIDPGRFRVIVLDAWYRLIPEGFDENNNAHMSLLYNSLDRIEARLGCAFVLIHHSTKGNQSEKAVTDVGSGAGAMARATDVHLALREHEEENAVVMEARVRSWEPVQPLCLRWEFPLWVHAPDLNPAALKRPPRRGRNTSPREQAAPAEPPPEPWTPERFVTAFIKPEPTDQKIIKARARAAAIPVLKVDDLLAIARADGLAHEWTFPKNRTVYFATTPQPVTATTGDAAPDSHSHTHTPPHTPRGTPKRPRAVGRVSENEADTQAPSGPKRTRRRAGL